MTISQKIYSVLKKALLLTLMVGCFTIGNITGSVFAAGEVYNVSFNVTNITIVDEKDKINATNGEDYIVEFVPTEGYVIDESSVRVTCIEDVFVEYTFDSSTNQLTIAGDSILSDFIISANAVVSTTAVNVTATSNNGVVESATQVNIGEDYHATFTANDGYILYPTIYTLTVGGTSILENTDAYTYDRSTGEVTVYGQYVTGDIAIVWNAQELVVKSSIENGYIADSPVDITLGSELQFTIVPNEYYKVPEDYHIVLYYGTSSGETVPDECYTYDTETGVVTIKAEYVTDVIYVSAFCNIKQATITYTLTNATYEQYQSYPMEQTNYLSTWYVYIKPVAGYRISAENVVVKMNGEVLEAIDSNYEVATSGRIWLKSGIITGDIEIIVEAVVDGVVIEYDFQGFTATVDSAYTDYNIPTTWPYNTSGFTIYLQLLNGYEKPVYTDTTAFTIFIDGEEAPARTGYWGLTSAYKLTLNKDTTKNYSHIRIYAHTTPIEYTITLTSGNHGSLTTNLVTYNVETQDAPNITNPITNTGYTFLGWKIIGVDGESNWELNATYEWVAGNYGNITLSAQYGAFNYTINFDDGDHGTIAQGSITYTIETESIVIPNLNIDDHYSLDYWQITSASGSWTTGQFNYVKGNYGNISIKAIYKLTEYTITLDPTSRGTLSGNNVLTYTIETTTEPTIETPTANGGYTFTGWQITTADGSWQVGDYSWTNGSYGNIVLTAQYEVTSYQITVLAGEHGTLSGDTVITYNPDDENITLPTVTTEDHYTFTGWQVTVGDGGWQVGDTFVYETGTHGNITITATYEETVYTIDLNDGDLSNITTWVYYYTYFTTDAPEIADPIPFNEGYVFSHWEVISSVGSWVGGEIYEWQPNSWGNVSLIARFTPLSNRPYTVYHYLETTTTGTYEIDNYYTQTLYGTTWDNVTVTPLNIPGFTFDEENENNRLNLYLEGDGNDYFNIYYTRDTYSISYELNGLTETAVSGYDPYSVKYGAQFYVNLEPEPGYNLDKANIKFRVNGEDIDLEYDVSLTSNKLYIAANVITGDLVIIASSRSNTFTVEYDLTGLGLYVAAEGEEQVDYTTATYQTEFQAVLILTADPDEYDKTTIFKSAEVEVYVDGEKLPYSSTYYTCNQSRGTITIKPNYVTGNIKIVAKAVPREYTITIIGDDGDTTITYTVLTDIVLTPSQKAGYNLTALSISPTAYNRRWQTLFADNLITDFNIGTGLVGNVKLTPIYEVINYTITLNAGEKGTIIPTTVNYTIVDTQAPEINPATAYDGYRFVKWEVASATGNWELGDYAWETGKYGNIVLSAVYDIHVYNITFDTTDDGTISGNNSTYTVQTIAAPTMPTVTPNNGYEFDKWMVTSNDGNWDLAEFNWVGGKYGNITVTATYKIITYTITYKVGIHGRLESNSNTYTIETTDEPTIPNLYIDNGYTFTNWQVTSAEGNWTLGAYQWKANSYGNVELTANYTLDTYTMTFVAGDHGTIDNRSTTYTVETESAPQLPNVTAHNGYVFDKWVVTDTDGNWLKAEYQWIKGNYGNLTITATYTAIPFTITIDKGTNGEVSKTSISYTIDTNEIEMPVVTPQAGYNFTGWQITEIQDGASWTLGEFSYAKGNSGNITITAIYEMATYTITYTIGVHGSLSSTQNTYNITTTNEPTLPTVTLDNGYKFNGWKVTSASANGSWTLGDYAWSANSFGDITVNAEYVVETYKITINQGSNGTVATDEVEYTVENKSAPVLPTATPNRGYKFTGWEITTVSGNWETGSYNWQSGKYGNITITAIYEIETYTITYITDEHGHLSIDSTTYTIETTDQPEMPVFTVDNGYRATNWTVTYAADSSWGSSEYTWVAGRTGNITVKANYEFVTYTINLVVGDYGTIDKQSVTYTVANTEAPVLPNVTVQKGYEFTGWTITAASGNWTEGDYAWQSGKYGDITITGNYQIEIYTITYMVGDKGELEFESNTYTINTMEQPTLPELTLDNGYRFVNWTITFATPNSGWTSGEYDWVAGRTGDITVTANYVIESYTITIDAGEFGEVEVNSVTYTVENTIQPTLPTLTTQIGYEFTGWEITTASGNWTTGNYAWESGKYGNITITAGYQIKTYTILYEIGEHGSLSNDKNTYTINTTTEPTLPTYTLDNGYEFVGWKITDIESETNWSKGTYAWQPNSYGNVTVTAEYKIITYTITFETSSLGEISFASTTYNVENVSAPTLPTATPNKGYEFAGWLVTSASGNWTADEYVWEQGRYGNITVTANYNIITYTITYVTDVHGRLSFDSAEYNVNTVQKPAMPEFTVDNGYKATNWTITYAADTNWSSGEYVWVAGRIGDFTVKANYELEKYTITLVVGTLGTIDTNTVEYTVENTTAPVLPNVTVQNGYNFTGWEITTASGNWTAGDYSWTAGKYGNITITAKYGLITYTIAYTTGEHGRLSFESSTYTIETQNKPALPVFTVDNGYRATNWTITHAADESWGTGEYTWVAGRTGNITVNANYVIETYTITLDGGEYGTCTTNNVTYNIENLVEPTIPSATPNKGYEFTGWQVTTADGNWETGDYLWSEGKYGNITITAIYEIETYIITYTIGSHGTLSSYTNTYDITTIIEPTLPQVSLDNGYKFTGWTITFATPNSGWTAGEYEWQAGRTGDITINANYEVEGYTITINAGAHGTVSTNIVAYNVDSSTAPVLPSVTPDAGYRFTGWEVTTTDGNWETGDYLWSEGKYGDITIIANYELIVYTITYVVGDFGSLSHTSNIYTIETTTEPTLPNVTLDDGFTFTGWQITSVEGVSNWTRGEYEWSTGKYGNITITANYSVQPFTITVIAGELGSVSTNAVVYEITNTVAPVLPIVTATTGYEFKSWEVTTADGNWDTGDYEWTEGKYGNITITARYELVTYTITYVTGSAGHLSFENSTYTIETTDKPAMPELTLDGGYKFDSWSVTNASSNSSWALGEYEWIPNSYGNITVTANYSIETYTITLSAGTLGRVDLTEITYTVENVNAPTLPVVTANNGYEFTNWQVTTASGNWTEGEYAWASGKYGNITLTANYNLITYTITYTIGSDGSLNTTTNTYTVETVEEPQLPTVTLGKGLQFTGWKVVFADRNSSWDLGTYNWELGSYGNITVNAEYEIITYKVTINQGYHGTVNVTEMEYNVKTNVLNLPVPTPDAGYHFTNWLITKVDEDSSWTLGDYSWSAGSYGNITIYAEYAPNNDTPYQIVYYLESLEGGFEASDIYSKDLEGFTDEVKYMEQLEIPGFYYDESNPDNVISGTVSATEKLVLKRYYLRYVFDVTFGVNEPLYGSVNATIITNVKYGTPVEVYKNQIKLGHQVVIATNTEWTVDTVYNFTSWSGANEQIVQSNLHITANFETGVRLYTIVFKHNNVVLQTLELEYSQIPEYTGETPTKEGSKKFVYRFDGWSVEGSDKLLTELPAAIENATYVAHFDVEQIKTTSNMTIVIVSLAGVGGLTIIGGVIWIFVKIRKKYNK